MYVFVGTFDDVDQDILALVCKMSLIAEGHFVIIDPSQVSTLRKPVQDSSVVLIGKEMKALFSKVTGLKAEHGTVGNSLQSGKTVLYLNTLKQLLSIPSLLPQYVAHLRKLHPVMMPGYQILECRTFQQVVEALQMLDKTSPTAFDIETNGLYWQHKDARTLCIVLAQEGVGIWIDGSLLNALDICHVLQRFFDTASCLIAHNATFDEMWLRKINGIKVRNTFDTMLMAYLVFNSVNRIRHGLKDLTQWYFNVDDYSRLIKKYTTGKNAGKGFENVPESLLIEYAIKDVVYTLMLWEKLTDHEEFDMEVFYSLVSVRSQMYQDVSERGIGLDIEQVSEYEGWLVELLDRHKEMLHQYVDNPSSPKQIASYLYDTLKLPQQVHKGKVTTNNAAIDKLLTIEPNNEFLLLLAQYRKLTKVLGTYMAGIRRLANVDQTRLHEVFKLHATVSGRLGSEVLLLLPRATNVWGKMVKSCFKARPGHVFLQADVSQLELRVLAYLSQDQGLLQVYENDLDLHSMVAKSLFGEDFTKEQRTMCKAVNFGKAYGAQYYSYVGKHGLDDRGARELFESYDRAYPQLARWTQRVHREALSQGYIESETGRKLHLGIVSDRNVNAVKRLVQNWVVQSFGSDIVQFGVEVLWKHYNAPIVLTVHDSVILECPVTTVQYWQKTVDRVMTDIGNEWLAACETHPRAVPFKLDVETPIARLAPQVTVSELRSAMVLDEYWDFLVEEDNEEQI